jgi:hypothetical protein
MHLIQTLSRSSLLYSSLALLSSQLLACNYENNAANDKKVVNEQKQADTTILKEDTLIAEAASMHYYAWPLKGNDSAKKALKERFSAEELYTIWALNRVDAKNYTRADTLIIPEKLDPNFLVYSPFPQQMPILKEVRKIVFFSYPIQAYGVYEQGTLVKWGPTSMGSKTSKTPTGLSFTNWKSKKAISTVKSEWILPWNFNIRNKEGVGWHQYDLPGYPASHSCLRLLEADAQWLYSWADQWILKDNNTLLAQGTPVIVFGDYPWGSRRPWKELLDDSNANNITQEMLKKEVAPFIDKILEAQSQRDQVMQERTIP